MLLAELSRYVEVRFIESEEEFEACSKPLPTLAPMVEAKTDGGGIIVAQHSQACYQLLSTSVLLIR